MRVCAGTQGYVYSSFLKAYNPQREVTERTDDFDNLSLFVSGSRRNSRSSSMRSFSQYSTSDSTSPSSEPLDEQDTSEDNHVRHINITFKVCVCSKTELFIYLFTYMGRTGGPKLNSNMLNFNFTFNIL